MQESEPNELSFAKFNRTELYQTCLRVGIQVLPSATNEEMIAYLEGEAEPPEIPEPHHPLHIHRLGLIDFVADHWKELETQLVCPMKMLKHPTKPDPRPCFKCIDVQVLTCLVSNQENEPLIDRYRLKRLKETK